MINNLILVGRLTEDPKIRTISENVKVCNINLAVTRPFKDMSTGEYGVDFVPVTLWNGISRVAYEYCTKGDIIGIKGRIADKYKEEDGIRKHYIEVIGERITLIQLHKSKDGLKLIDDGEEFDEIPIVEKGDS